jgi:citrate synthase
MPAKRRQGKSAHDIGALARTRSLEDVVSLLWTGAFDADIFDTPLHVVGGEAAGGLPFLSRAQSVLPLVAARDELAFDLSLLGVARTGWRVLNLLTSVAAESHELEATVEETLARVWAAQSADAPSILRAALIVSAGNEPDVTSVTARCVASARSNPYSVVTAALAALDGLTHGGAIESVETLFDELGSVRGRRRALAARLRRDGAVGGFAAESDARASLLLEMLPKSKELTFLRSVSAAAEDVLNAAPTLDLALVALSRSLNLPRGSALVLYALGRTIDWIAHAAAEYAESSEG